MNYSPNSRMEISAQELFFFHANCLRVYSCILVYVLCFARIHGDLKAALKTRMSHVTLKL